MKMLKKLLTVLPIATIGVVTPMVVSGCSCSSSITINYGDSINCKNKDDKNYHSIDEIKNASKNHIQPCTKEKLLESDLVKWDTNKPENQQFFYWDLIYSAANSALQFTLTWEFKDATKKETSKVTYNEKSSESLSYDFDDEGKVVIKMNGEKLIESYSYSTGKKA